jgi:hypothetical protein
MNFILYLLLFFPIALCQNDQQHYFENERAMFNVSKDELPFNYSEFSSKQIDYFPTCDGIVNVLKSKNDKLNVSHSVPDKTIYGNDFIIKGINYVWRFAGWEREIHHDEEYWFYNNTKSDNVVVYFHGINSLDGIENMYALNQLKQNASVYFSIYKQTFLLDHAYEHSLSEHIDNVNLFINGLNNVALVGNSFGSVRITMLCKRYDCSKCSKLILTDPISINLPYAQMLKHIMYGVFFQHKSTTERRNIITVNALRYNKLYTIFEQKINWYEWSIDTPFIEKYKDTLVLVIGDNDNLLSIDKTSYALTKLCRVIYTNTRHGMVLATTFLSQIQLNP